MERIKLYSDRVWISEQEKDPEILTLRILISTFEPNLNGVLLNRATIDTWLDSILTKPLVAKIAYKTDKSGKNQIADFTGHNVSFESYIDENGVESERVVFDTQAFGTIVSAAIENIDGKEGIVIVAHVWRRYYTATEIIERRIKEGNLHTSWEISVIDYEKKIIGGQLVKVINKGIFSADTMLGNAYPPAFPTARILDVASDENDMELCDALVQDTMSLNENSKGKEVEKMNEETIVNVLDTGGVENAEEEKAAAPERAEEARPAEGEEEKVTPIAEKAEEATVEPVVEVNPLQSQLDEAAAQIKKLKSELDEKNTALIEAQRQINELQPFKSVAEQAAREKAEAERKEAIASLRKYAEESGMLSKEELVSGEIAEMIESLNETGIKVLIADRIVEKGKKSKPAPEVAQKQPKVRTVLTDNAPADSYSVLKDFLRK